jgi:hypothetical protein
LLGFWDDLLQTSMIVPHALLLVRAKFDDFLVMKVNEVFQALQ